jgi:hypothetical protein
MRQALWKVVDAAHVAGKVACTAEYERVVLSMSSCSPASLFAMDIHGLGTVQLLDTRLRVSRTSCCFDAIFYKQLNTMLDIWTFFETEFLYKN